jgi:predicted  nucleic acid-binding Zn-ribbon protein
MCVMAAATARRVFMAKDDPTQQVLDLRQRVDRAKTRTTEARTKKKAAEDQLTAADDAIEQLGLDPDRDLERQENRLIESIREDLGQLEGQLDEAESVLA